MGDIVNYIVGKEKEAENIINEAREKALEIVRKAEAEAAKIVNKAREDARHILQDEVLNVEREIENKKKSEVEKINREFDTFLEENKSIIDELVSKVTKTVVTTKYDEVL